VKTKILLAESRDLHRLGLAAIFCGDARVSSVQEATSQEELQEQLRLSLFDYVFVNQAMIDTMSIMTLPRGRFVILAPELDTHVFQLAYWRGACGYLLERTSAEVILLVLSLPQDAFLIEPSLMPQILEYLSRGKRFLINDSLLTPREKEIIALMREGVDRSTIAARLCISRATLKTHMKNIMYKLKSSPPIGE
jgi:DNA-binding NarL/FixJ family response regulator